MTEKIRGPHFERFAFENAYKKAEKKLGAEAIDPREHLDTFVALYGGTQKEYRREEIEKDLREAEKLKAEFARQSAREPEKDQAQKTGKILEAIIHEESELAEWLGPEAFTTKTSDYDDFKNHIDTVVEFRSPEKSASHLAFAIDVTMATFAIGAKLESILKAIERGELGRVKYFISGVEQKPMGLEKIPHVIVGMNGKTVEELAELWIEKKHKELGAHRVQFMILEEIRMQLDAFKRFAESVRVQRSGIAAIFADALARIKDVMREKEKYHYYPPEEFMNDRTFAALKEYCDGIAR